MSQPHPLQLGAHVHPDGVYFRCFAAAEHCGVQLVGEDGAVLLERKLEPLGDGYFEGLVPEASAGSLYYFWVDGRSLPDPYARYLPQGVDGPARVEVSQYTFRHAPPRRTLSELVIYELHLGTFTDAGTFAAATERLPEVAALGVTAIQLMPVAAFAGERGWGYDGVALYAPHVDYGTPDQLRQLVDAAHGLGLSVLLDVVYNHFGPAGNYLTAYAPEYFRQDEHNVWGQVPDYTHPALRRLMLDNARYWLVEFGFDGLRLDATHAILDPSPQHLLRELSDLAAELQPPRWLIAEDERNLADLITDVGLSAVWADDFHHQVRVTLTGERSSYFAAFEPAVERLAEAINRGWLYSGQVNPVTKEPRGTSADALPAETLVYCIQNHDQVGNRALGDRLPPGDAYRAASLLLLFLPMTPLLFMGQEWAATTPFLYFTDHDAEIGRQVTEGRRREFAEFVGHNAERVPNPQDRETFLASKLNWHERDGAEQARTLELYRAALELRRSDSVWSNPKRDDLLAEVVNGALVVQRVRGAARRVLVANFGDQPVSLEPLLQRFGLPPPSVQIASGAPPTHSLAANTAAVFAD